MLDTRLELDAPRSLTDTDLDAGLVSEMMHADAAYPVSFGPYGESNATQKGTAEINTEVRNALSLYTSL